MTTGDKLAKLRKNANYTQEQLAEILGVSRQAVSKWESDLAFPETEKLIRISELYGCSLDYLLKGNSEPDVKESKAPQEEDSKSLFTLRVRFPQERKSERLLWGMPLYHIGKNAHGVFAVGLNAKGIVALGMKARGVVSVGLLSIGVISFGTLSLGLLAFGVFALGLAAAGAIAAGIISAGAISLGIFSVGAIAVGDFSVGALAVGKYGAIGDNARGMIAIGDSEAHGTLFEKLGELTPRETERVSELLRSSVPGWLGWARSLFESRLG